MESGVGVVSPRISFSRDFVEVGAAVAAASGCQEEAATGSSGYSSEFEFAMAACSDSRPQGCASAAAAAMLPADKLISHGMLLSFAHSLHSCSHSLAASASGCVSASTPSYPPSRRELSLPLSPKAPTCGAKWREFLGLKGRCCDCIAASKGASPPYFSSKNIMKRFYRSRSMGSGEVDSTSTSHTFLLQEDSFSDSSSLENGSRWTDDADGYTESAVKLWAQAGGVSKIEDECTSAGVDCPSDSRSGNPAIRDVAKSSSYEGGEQAAMRNMERDKSNSFSSYSSISNYGRSNIRYSNRDSTISYNSSSCISTSSSCISSSYVSTSSFSSSTSTSISYSSSNYGSIKIPENARNAQWEEHWRLGDATTASSKTRVAPVLLNVPACMAPSLRSLKLSKSKLITPHHLLPPKKPHH